MSPIPLGILAAAGGSAPAMDLISTVTLTGGASDIGFNVSSLSTTYQHLQVRLFIRGNSNQVFTGNRAGLRINGSTTNYGRNPYFFSGYGSTNGFFEVDSATNLASIGHYSSWFNGGPEYGAIILDILDPFEAKAKTFRSLSGDYQLQGTDNGTRRIGLYHSRFNLTTSISTINLIETGGYGFVAGSRFSLYGIKAS